MSNQPTIGRQFNIKYPIIETLPYPTSYFLKGDDFIDEISKEGIEITD